MTERAAPTDSETIDEKTVAYHEAGHAIQYFLEDCDLEFIELTPGGDNHGRAKPRSASSVKLTSAQHVRISLAGIAAEFVLKETVVPSTADELFRVVLDVEGWEPDWDRAEHYALQLAGEEKHEAADELRFQLFKDVLESQTLHRDKITLVASQLLRERRLSGDTLKSLLGA